MMDLKYHLAHIMTLPLYQKNTDLLECHFYVKIL